MAIVTEKTLRHGEIRNDGFVFWSYRNKPNGYFKEEWYSPEKFLAKKDKASLRRKTTDWGRRGWNTPNSEARKKWRREYYLKNGDKERQQARAYKRKRIFLEKVRLQKWNLENRDKRNASDAKRRAQILGSLESLTVLDKKLIETFYEASDRVSKCLGLRHHVDHIIPLAKGGSHRPENLQTLPWRLNLSKGAKVL